MPARDRVSLSGVAVGDFIAYTPFYLEEVPQDKRKPFYVARVLALKETAVQVQTYITGTKGLSILNTSRRVVYKKFLGPQNVQDVAAEDIITTIELTHTHTLKAAAKRKIHLLLDEKVLDAMVPEKTYPSESWDEEVLTARIDDTEPFVKIHWPKNMKYPFEKSNNKCAKCLTPIDLSVCASCRLLRMVDRLNREKDLSTPERTLLQDLKAEIENSLKDVDQGEGAVPKEKPRCPKRTRQRTQSKIIGTLHNVPLSCIKIDELAQNGGTRQRPLSPDRETINCPDAEAKELPRDNELPASIYVQLDTCPGENHTPDAAVPEEPCPEAKESEPVPWYRRYNEVLR